MRGLKMMTALSLGVWTVFAIIHATSVVTEGEGGTYVTPSPANGSAYEMREGEATPYRSR